MERYRSLSNVYGSENLKGLQSSKVLLIGAGGIGCEILKNLAIIGFQNIEVIDLDTIDVSNLNRQFLFRSHHVGMSKSLVAAEAAKRFNPHINIVPHHANIKDSKFGKSYFKSFDIVLNALDNVDARRHVNRLCLASDVPLIDSGTTGYLGQTMPIIKNVSACYECKPKPTQKVYPVCTIRSTPDKPVHCIVWAKELFKLMLGNPTDSMLYEDTKSTGESSTYMHLIDNWHHHPDAGSPDGFYRLMKEIYNAIFNTEIQKRIDMDVYKTASKVPVSIDSSLYEEIQTEVIESLSHSRPQRSNWDTAVWTVKESFIELTLALYESFKMSISTDSEKESMIGKLSFDKDDEMTMRFVCAAANIRSSIFSIPQQSYHDAKGIAGNIIPAISTTNAIVAAIQVMEAVKILTASDRTQVKLPHVYCLREPQSRKRLYLMPTEPDDPVEGCLACNTSQIEVEVDTMSFTLNDFVKKILKDRLGFVQPCVMIGSSIIYEEYANDDSDVDEDDKEFFNSNLSKSLIDCPGGGLKNDSIVLIKDHAVDVDVTILITHIPTEVLSNMDESISTSMFNIVGGNFGSNAVKKQISQNTNNGDDNDDDMVEVIYDDITIIDDKISKKRDIDDGNDVKNSSSPRKRTKIE